MVGRTLSDTPGQHHSGPPASDVYVLGGTREEGGCPPGGRGGHREVDNKLGGGDIGGVGRDCGGGGGGRGLH